MFILKHYRFSYGIIRVPTLKMVCNNNIMRPSIYCMSSLRNKILMKSYFKESDHVICNARKYSLFNRVNHAKFLGPKHASTWIIKNTIVSTANTIPFADIDTAELFVDLIKEDLKENASFVIDPVPFRGHLAKALLDKGVPRIYAFESLIRRTKELKLLEDEYGERLRCIDLPLLALTNYLSGKFVLEVDIVNKIIDELPTKKWTEEPCMQIVGIARTSFFMTQILSATIFQSNLMTRGRVSFYIAIGPLLWKTLYGNTAKFSLYRHTSVLFQLFFNCKHFGAIQDAKFEGKFQSKMYNRYWVNRERRLGVQVVKVEPKPDLFDILSREQLFAFWFFLRTIMFRRTKRIIPLLESWVPGCGPLLIAQNINMYTYVGDLSPERLLEIFLIFSSWPEYKTTQFFETLQKIQGLNSGLTFQ